MLSGKELLGDLPGGIALESARVSAAKRQAKGKAALLLVINNGVVVFSSDEEARSVIESCS